MFAFTRFSKNVQLNVFSRDLRSAKAVEPEFHREVEAHGYLELSLTFGATEHMKKQGKRISKTVKFYCSPGGDAFEHTAGGKAFSYVNKLLQGNWITDEEYDVLYGAIQTVVASNTYASAMKVEHPEMDIVFMPLPGCRPQESYGHATSYQTEEILNVATRIRLDTPVTEVPKLS
jgi:hypothetical protein